MKMLIATLAIVVALGAQAQPTSLTEGFDSGLGSFSTFNASNPVGNDWFHGNAGVFASQAGAADAYAANSFNATSAVSGVIAAWLISPEITFIGQTASFYARTADLGFLDSITLMVSTNGASTDINDFSALLTIGPGALTDGWALYSALLGNIGSGRIAFLYSVGNALDADYVGIDTVSVTGGDGTGVPEPASLALVALGLGLIGFVHWRKRRIK